MCVSIRIVEAERVEEEAKTMLGNNSTETQKKKTPLTTHLPFNIIVPGCKTNRSVLLIRCFFKNALFSCLVLVLVYI